MEVDATGKNCATSKLTNAGFWLKTQSQGIDNPTASNTRANANEKRDWRIFSEFAHVLIQEATVLYANEPIGGELQ